MNHFKRDLILSIILLLKVVIRVVFVLIIWRLLLSNFVRINNFDVLTLLMRSLAPFLTIRLSCNSWRRDWIGILRSTKRWPFLVESVHEGWWVRFVCEVWVLSRQIKWVVVSTGNILRAWMRIVSETQSVDRRPTQRSPLIAFTRISPLPSCTHLVIRSLPRPTSYFGLIG